jgi:hypothetical protein
MKIEEDRIDLNRREFERKLYELRLGSRPGFLVRSPAGWELSTNAPSLGSGPYFERLSNGLVRKWHNHSTADMSYTDL